MARGLLLASRMRRARWVPWLLCAPLLACTPPPTTSSLRAVAPPFDRPWATQHIEPVVARMPASAERSIQSVGAYLRDHEPNPVLRVKALHDWVADRIAWDPHDGAGDAGGAFARRRATRVGFAHLLAELSDAGGADIRFTTGMTYSEDHWRRTGRTAWNEVVLGDKTYSIDVALDAGALFYPRHARWPLFLKQYRTTYFLPSVATFAETHAADFSLAAWPHTNTSPVDHSALWFLADD